MRRSAWLIALFSLTISTLASGSDADATRHALGGGQGRVAGGEPRRPNDGGRRDGDAGGRRRDGPRGERALASAMRFEQVRDKDGLRRCG